MPSFTSSFNRMSFKRIINTSLFWLVIFSFVFDICFFRSNFFYSLIPNSSAGQIEVLSNRLDMILAKSKLKILILGDSQNRDGFNPEIFAENLGVSTDNIFNLSISSGEPIDAYNLYMRNRKDLKDVKSVIVGVSEWQFNKVSNTNPPQKYRRYATLIDRFDNNEPEADLLLGYFCGAYDHREIWKNIIDLTRSGEWPPPQIDEYQWGLLPNTQNKPIEDRYNLGKERLEQWYGNGKYEISDTSKKYLIKLIDQLKEDNKTIIVVNTPKSTIYYDLRNDLNLNTEFEVYKQFIYDICSNKDLFLFFYDKPWDDSYFRDINHLNPEGAKKLTEEISIFLLSDV